MDAMLFLETLATNIVTAIRNVSPDIWLAVVILGAVTAMFWCFAATRHRDEPELIEEPEPLEQPAPVRPAAVVPPKPNPVHVRIVERLDHAIEHGDTAAMYRCKARLAAGGWPIPDTREDCEAEIIRLESGKGLN